MSLTSKNPVAKCGADITKAGPAPLTRTVLVHINGTPAMMDSLGGSVGCWSLTPEQAVKIFASNPTAPYDDALREIKNVILNRVTLLGYRSNAPDVCGLQIEGLPGGEFTQSGEDHHIFILGNGESNIPQDVFVAQGNNELGVQWVQQFPEFNRENIRNEKVMRLNGSDYYFVHETHPVVNLLYHNQDKLGLVMAPRDKVNTDWYRVDLDTFEDSCHTLNSEVFDKTPQIFDLSGISIRMRRPDNRRWMDPPIFMSALADQKTKEAKYKEYTETPIMVLARIQLEFIPCVPRAP